MTTHMIGIYEKALTENTNLLEVLQTFQKTTFDYVEIAIDDSEERIARLALPTTELKQVQRYMTEHSLSIRSIVLSANRTFPLGSSIEEVRKKGKSIVYRAIDFATTLSIPVIQIAGYYVFSEARDGQERERFLQALSELVDYAASKGVMLALENMDGEDILSIAEAKQILDAIRSPWLQLYPDVGNLVANGLKLEDELIDIAAQTVSIHLKDTRRNVFRRIPFGEGEVDFQKVAELLSTQGYRGSYTIEMWNDGSAQSVQLAEEAYQYLKKTMNL